MDLISGLSSYITDLASTISPAVNGSTVNLKNIEQRETVITELSLIKSAFDDINERLTGIINNAKAIQTKDLEEMDAFIGRLRGTKTDSAHKPRSNPEMESSDDDQSWTRVVRKVDRKFSVPPKVVKPDPEPKSTNIVPAPKRAYTSVKFTEALALPAISVPTFDYVQQDGELYYVESADHFAFKLAGRLLHGNIGVIYTEEKSPVKIKNCKFANQCVKKDRCDYYHDPTHFHGSSDYRNYIASSWLYAPPNSQFKNKTRSRRFGSRDHLDTDIVDLQEEETSRFYDQTMHDFLCSMLLMQYHTKS